MTLSTVSLLLALSWGGTRYPWASPQIGALIAAFLLLGLGFAWRLRTAEEPMIPLAILANPVVRMGTLAACFGMGTFIGLTIYLPLYFETVAGLSAARSGLGLLPLTCGTVIGASSSGRAMAKMTNYKRVPMIGLALALVGTVFLVLGAGTLSLWQFMMLLVIISTGFGSLLPICTVSIQNAVQQHQIGTATAVANFFRQIGGALIVAIYGAIVLGGVGGGAGRSPEALQLGHVDREAMVTLFRYVFAATFVGFALAYLFLARMKQLPLRTSMAAQAAQAE